MMSIEEFGKGLIETGDLDPVYIVIVGAELSENQKRRLLTAYWCFYHLGAAAWLSEHKGKDFWKWMLVAAENVMPSPLGERWSRAAERRHFRGKACVSAIEWMQKEAPEPEWLVKRLESCLTAKSIGEAVQLIPMHGPWIAFKAADMMERVMGIEVSFPDDLCLIYKEPLEGLKMLADDLLCTPMIQYRRLLKYFSAYKAPPTRDRPCGVQEVETILCKWKSHRYGKYEIGKDIEELRNALAGWGKTADKLLKAAPKESV